MAIAKPRVRRLVVLCQQAENPVIIDLGEQIEQIDVYDALKTINMMEQAEKQIEESKEDQLIRYVRVQGPYFGYHCQWAESLKQDSYAFLISDNPKILYQNILDFLVTTLADCVNEQILSETLHDSLNRVYLYIVLNEMPKEWFNKQEILTKYINDIFIGLNNLNTGKEALKEHLNDFSIDSNVNEAFVDFLFDEPKKLKELFKIFTMIDKGTFFRILTDAVQKNILIALTTKPIEESKISKSAFW